MIWNTDIIKSDVRIITLSDIHGDIHSLIVALRDCGQVIKKKNTTNFDFTIIDKSVEELLEYDLNNDLNKDILFYKDDLDYEWSGGETYVVICGDFLDGFRDGFGNYRISPGNSRCKNCMDLEYDQVEIKIFRFINAINAQAMEQGGRIFKILGNHEFINLNDNSLNNYIPKWTKSLDNYYNNKTRDEYFKLYNEGADLIFKDGAGILLKINNIIFVHGRLDHEKTFKDYVKINNNLNLPNKKKKKIRLIRKLNSSCNITTWGRKYSRNFNLYANEIELSSNQTEKCKQIKDHLGKFIKGIDNNLYCIEDMKIVIGHCPQNMMPYNIPIVNSSFTTIKSNKTHEELTYPVRTSLPDIEQHFIFGIGMECNKNDLDNPKEYPDFSDNDTRAYIDYDDRYIYKVDVASSRAFDQRIYESITFSKKNEINTIGSRVSQILEFNNNKINIKRSTIKNTRIHQPRHEYEKYILENSINELNIKNY